MQPEKLAVTALEPEEAPTETAPPDADAHVSQQKIKDEKKTYTGLLNYQQTDSSKTKMYRQ